MKLRRIIIIVGGVIIFSNLILYYLVRMDGVGIIISLAVSITEVIILGIAGWYCMQKSPAKKSI
ncbi:MAG TPA: hypothetical protein VND99_01630 [Candidatus Acidoferrales bacterium]|nr:hypothetical protein [Candidatus Acidoferrales bacterium]